MAVICQDPILEMFLRNTFKLAAVQVVLEHDHERQRNMDQRIAIASARFQEQDPILRIFGEAVRQHAASGARADDDVVVVS